MRFAKKGFTLIELMIVVAIIGILAAIAVPNFMSLKTRATIASLKANMHIIQMAAEDFSVMAEGYYPEKENTKVEDVLSTLGYIGVENKKSITGAKGRGKGKGKGKGDREALLPEKFENPFNADDPAIKNGSPPATPPSGTCYYTGYNLVGSETARGYSVCAYEKDRPLALILSNGS